MNDEGSLHELLSGLFPDSLAKPDKPEPIGTKRGCEL